MNDSETKPKGIEKEDDSDQTSKQTGELIYSNLPGTCFTTIEAADIQSKTNQNLERNRFFSSICENYRTHGDWWTKTEAVLKQTSGISSETGFASLIMIDRDRPNYKNYLALYLSNPAAFKSFEAWALFQAAQEAEIKFLEYCSKPNIEIALSASLIAILDCKSDSIQNEFRKYLSITESQLNVKKLELQVQNREKKTGGDFALLFEWKDKAGSLRICPIIFQAKRINTTEADISQYNEDTGYQFDVLSRSKCNPAYIFYNCDTSTATPMPRLPTVKKVADVKTIGAPDKTSSVENVLSFSMFILDVMSSDQFFTTDSRQEALNRILSGMQELELFDVVTFSIDPSAIHEYETEYKRYKANKANEGGPDSSSNDAFE